MRGIAGALYLERAGEGMIGSSQREEHWPILSKLLSLGRLSYVDYAFACRLLGKKFYDREDFAAFLCHLTVSAREGHLCVRMEKERMQPDPKFSWLAPFSRKGDEKVRLSEEEMSKIRSFILSGALEFPSELLFDVEGRYSEEALLFPVYRLGSLFYLHRHWVYESVFLENFKRLSSSSPHVSVDLKRVEKQVADMEKEGVLLREQARAIEKACGNCFMIITGGPGTGKTYTAGFLIKVFLENVAFKGKKELELVLASPTGKAAFNLQESLEKVFSSYPNRLKIVVKTLHSLLKVFHRPKGRKKNIYKARKPLSADFILVDESSMIDVRLMAKLFSSVKDGARLVLLGDRNQLSPVESGSLFSDLTHICKNRAGFSAHLLELKRCMRSDLKEIVSFSQMVREGKAETILRTLSEGKERSVVCRLFSEEFLNEKREDFLRYILSYFPRGGTTGGENPGKLLREFRRFRILSPVRKGLFGVDTINNLLFCHFAERSSEDDFLAIPIIITHNNYKMEFFNGEVGLLFKRMKKKGRERRFCLEEDYAIFPGKDSSQPYFDSDLQLRKVPALVLPRYEYAYCLSVHKSQGSEFDTVLLLLPEGARVFGREVLYTAITRARKSLKIIADDEVIKEVLYRRSQRVSGVRERLEF